MPLAVAIVTTEAGRRADMQTKVKDVPLCRVIADNRFPFQEFHDISAPRESCMHTTVD